MTLLRLNRTRKEADPDMVQAVHLNIFIGVYRLFAGKEKRRSMVWVCDGGWVLTNHKTADMI